MSEEQLDLQKRQVELMEEILKELKINNKLLVYLNIYSDDPTTPPMDPEERELVEIQRTKPI